MQVQKDIIIPGAGGLPISLDIFYPDEAEARPVIVYAHGFNGFKDWGNFDLIAEQAIDAGFSFVKFNFSHNGTSHLHPQDFVNLEAFGHNNYSKQLYDLDCVVNWITGTGNSYEPYLDKEKLYLIGHSMGGGIAILYASRDIRVKKLVTWASINECKTPWGSWDANKMEVWKKDGVAFYPNSRTGQQMPMYYQLFEDFKHHKEELDIMRAMKGLEIPVLICHGTSDTSVSVDKALTLQQMNPAAELFTLDTDHVFGRKHPWTSGILPEPMQKVVKKTFSFLQEN